MCKYLEPPLVGVIGTSLCPKHSNKSRNEKCAQGIASGVANFNEEAMMEQTASVSISAGHLVGFARILLDFLVSVVVAAEAGYWSSCLELTLVGIAVVETAAVLVVAVVLIVGAAKTEQSDQRARGLLLVGTLAAVLIQCSQEVGRWKKHSHPEKVQSYSQPHQHWAPAFAEAKSPEKGCFDLVAATQLLLAAVAG